ncbi:MAG: hypothetical protein U0325_29785 [Polyangiales bacterium]
MAIRDLGTVLALILGGVLTPDDAFAQGIGTPTFDGLGLALASVAIGGGVIIGGLVTDGYVLHDIAVGQGVRRAPAIAGTVLWGLTTAIMLPVSIGLLTGSGIDGEALAALLGADALVFGSLGLSIYGLTLPAPAAAPAPASPPAQTPWLQRVSMHPGVIPAANGLAPGLLVSFRM